MMRRLNKLKSNLQQWNKEFFGNIHSQNVDLSNSSDLDVKEHSGGLTEEEREARRSLEVSLKDGLETTGNELFLVKKAFG